MPTESERLHHIEQQQERIIDGIAGLTGAIGAMHGSIKTLMEWLQRPPKNDLHGAVQTLIAVNTEMRKEMQDTVSVVRALVAVVGEMRIELQAIAVSVMQPRKSKEEAEALLVHTPYIDGDGTH